MMADQLTWSELLNWISGLIITVLTIFLRTQWTKTSVLQETLQAVVAGVEKGTQQSGDKTVKQAIRNEALDAGVTTHLKKVVDKVAETDPSSTKGPPPLT